MKLWSRYHVAQSVEQALSLLAQYEGRAQIIAGGTDLLVDLQQDVQFNNHSPLDALIDITRIEEINAIDVQGHYAVIGAGVTHSAIESHPVIRSRATCLTESCGVVGGPQVRNVATIGGNVVHALPAADGTLSLVALEAEAEIATPDGHRQVPIADLYLGPGKSLVNPARDVLVRFRVPLIQANEGAAFTRMMRPQGVALPILGCAVNIKLDSAGKRFEKASICVAPIFPTPRRATELEKWLAGQPANDETVAKAAQFARESLHPRGSKYRATAAYRTEMIELLVRRSLHTALTRALTGESIPEGVA